MKTRFGFKQTLWLFVIIFFILTFSDKGGGDIGFRSLDLTHALGSEATFSIDSYHTNTVDKSFYKGQYYAVVPPGYSILSLPAYRYGYIISSLLKNILGEPAFDKLTDKVRLYYIQEGRFLPDNTFINQEFLAEFFIISYIVQLTMSISSCMILFIVSLYFFSDYKHINGKIFAYLIVFSTPLFHNSTGYSPTVLVSAIIFIAVFSVTRLENKNPSNQDKVYLMLLGILSSVVVLFSYSLIFVPVLILAYVLLFKKRRHSYYIMIGVLIPILLMLAYNWAIFDNPLSFPYGFVPTEIAANHEQGAFGITYPKVDAIYGLTFSAFRGLFVYSPILLLYFMGLYRMWKKSKSIEEIQLFVLIPLAAVLFFSSYKIWHGDLSFGPRHLVPVIPVMFIPIAYVYHDITGYIRKALVTVSVFIGWLGVQFGGSPYAINNPIIDFYVKQLIAKGPSSNLIDYLGFFIKMPDYLSIALNMIILLVICVLVYLDIRAYDTRVPT